MIDQFLSQYAPSTAKVNAQVLREAAAFMGKPLEKASTEDIISYQSSISSSSKNTQKRKLATLSAYYKYLTVREIIPKNPMVTIRLPKPDRIKSIVWLNEDEMEALLDSTTGQDRAIIAAGLSGLRVSEIASLNVDQVSEGRLWNVEGKGGKVRTVPLTKQAAEAIEAWAQGRRRGPLFTLQRGRRISTRSIQNVVYRATTKALGRRVHPHALRHSLATLGAKKDIPVMKLGKILGHANPAVTEIYVHLDADDLVDEIHKLDRKPAIREKEHLRLVHSA
jgi:site-specific recombinase XerD